MTTQSTPAPGLPELPKPRLHRLKTDPEVYQAVLSGRKTFEIRMNDRDFRVGDELLLMETTTTGEAIRAGAPLQYTGNEMRKRVSHVLSGYGLMPDWVCLSFEAGSAAAAQAVPKAMKIVCDAMRADPEYAWSWHCNIAMAFVDEGGNHAVGNHAAARFLRSLADVEPAHELPPRFELSDERIMQYLDPWHIQGDADDRADLIQCVRAMLAAAPTQGAEGAEPQAVVGEASEPDDKDDPIRRALERDAWAWRKACMHAGAGRTVTIEGRCTTPPNAFIQRTAWSVTVGPSTARNRANPITALEAAIELNSHRSE